jgi:hypothetical protein
VLVEPGDHRTGFTRNRVLTSEAKAATDYRESCRRAIERMESDEQRGPGPEQVARLVSRVIRSSNPRLRYSVGPASQRLAVWLKRLGPHRLVEKVMEAYYRV